MSRWVRRSLTALLVLVLLALAEVGVLGLTLPRDRLAVIDVDH